MTDVLAKYLLLLVPILYAGLQYAAIMKLEDGWRGAAYLPAGIMTVAYTFQVLLGIADPAFAALFPLTGMILSSLYLAALLWLHGRELRASRGRPCRRPAEIFALKDYR